MHFAILSIFLTLLSYIHITAGLGINCRGSSQCSQAFESVGSSNLIANFNESLWIGGDSHLPNAPINDQAFYYFGDHIMCARNGLLGAGSICLFPQGNIPDEGIPGFVIKLKIAELAAHGCKFCGSVPVGSYNDPAPLGILTVNYVLGKACQGLCSPGNTTADVVPLAAAAVVNQTITTIDDPKTAMATEDPQTRLPTYFTAVPTGL